MAYSWQYGYLSANNSDMIFQPSIGSAYPLIYEIAGSKVYPGLIGVCFMRTVTYPESKLFLAPIQYCRSRPGVDVVPYLSYELFLILRDPKSKMCLAKEEKGNGAILSYDACKTGSFLLIPSNNK